MQSNTVSTPTGSTTDRRWTAIRTKLEAVRDILETAGSIVRRKESSSRDLWCVRFRQRVDGKLHHRSIYLGDTAIAKRDEALIASWRVKSREQLRREERLILFDQLALARGYSKRARRRLRAAAEEAFGDPMVEFKMATRLLRDDADIRLGKPPGRPAKSGLW